MLIESLRDEEINLCVQTLGGMCTDFDLLGSHVVSELEDTRFNLRRVSRRRDVGREPLAKLAHGTACICEE